jgi:D-xylose transport system permease protein
MSNLDRSINGLQPGPQPPGQPELSHPVDHWLRRFQSGNLGSLPVVAGVLAVCVIFGLLEPRFLSERNFVNLILQMAGIFATAIGVVFVLLVAEVDLSIAYVGAVGSITMTLLLREDATDWSWWLAIGVALLLTALIGLLHGFIITKAHAPSFVVTLAGLLVWNGVVLILTTQFSTSGTIAIHNPIVLGIANSYLNHMWSWMIYGLSLAVYSVLLILKRYFQLRQNVPATPIGGLLIQILGMALVAGAAIWYANRDRGVPAVAVISLALLVFWSAVATQTRFGRYVYAVGGNPEAARRAGIDVDWIRIVVFMISGLMAGVGGIILASRLRSVDTNTGGANLLLNAIAAAIIGGTSLFGGRGKVSNALLGALTIATVENGMGLLGLPSGVRIVINGIVLLAAVLVDTLSRHQRGHLGS